MEVKDLCIRWLLADYTSLGSTTSKLALKVPQGVRAKLSYEFPIRITSTSKALSTDHKCREPAIGDNYVSVLGVPPYNGHG